jgi:hypothetical protein
MITIKYNINISYIYDKYLIVVSNLKSDNFG